MPYKSQLKANRCLDAQLELYQVYWSTATAARHTLRRVNFSQTYFMLYLNISLKDAYYCLLLRYFGSSVLMFLVTKRMQHINVLFMILLWIFIPYNQHLVY